MNSYALARTTPSRWRVYRFHHLGTETDHHLPSQGFEVPGLTPIVSVMPALGNTGLIPRWQEWEDSNPRQAVLETAALPTELHSCAKRNYSLL